MQCKVAQTRLYRLMDNELSEAEREQLESHLAACPPCTREWKILSLPRRIGESIPVLEPSPHFCLNVRDHLDGERQNIRFWPMLLTLSRQIVPAMTILTLILVSVFVYTQFRQNEVDVYRAYEGIYITGDQSERMVIEEQGELTDEALLRALAGNAIATIR